jgi:hypothetical protein
MPDAQMNKDEPIEDTLLRFQQSLLKEFEVGGLYSRNNTAHKWKAPFRSLVLREVVFWRTTDLLQQSYALYKLGHLLGARILVRSALETVAVLSYVNQKTDDVVDGKLNFHEFSLLTSRMLLGSRDGSTAHETVNILSAIKRFEKRFPGVESFYAALSEAAHPNHEGLLMGYSKPDTENFVEKFANHWQEIYGTSHEKSMSAVAVIFEYEYNEAWPRSFAALEQFLVDNDVELEATKNQDRA